MMLVYLSLCLLWYVIGMGLVLVLVLVSGWGVILVPSWPSPELYVSVKELSSYIRMRG